MKTILTATFRHETNRLSPGLTTFEDYRNRFCVYGDAAVRAQFAGTKDEMWAFLTYFDVLTDYGIQPILALNASPGPVVAQEVFDDTCTRLVDAVKAAPKVDGILLCLHGAMVTERYEDGEGVLLEALRKAAGPDVPIVATLDLHANVTQKMIDNATALFAYRCNPHTDTFETGLRACKCLHDTLEGRIRPVMSWARQDMLLPITPTAHPVMAEYAEKAQALSDTPGMLDVSICHGFFLGDIHDMGLSVLAVTDGEPQLAQKTAAELSDAMFADRLLFQKETATPQEAVRMAMESDSFPVVLADVADNPGCGASVDSTGLLAALLEAGAKDTAFAVMYDPEMAETAARSGVGSTITVSLGGKTAPERTGGPVAVTAYVKAITDGQFRNRDEMYHGLLMKFGKCALLVAGDIQIIVCSVRSQPWDLEIYRHIGIRPEDMKILAVKSAAHFRASFGKIAAKIIEVDAPGIAPPDPKAAGLTHIRRPIYPLDEI